MSYLRHISTRRLLALVAGCSLAIGVGAAAIALAAGGTGTTPLPQPLADAIHDALAAPQPAGVTARIDFTNHLVDAASLQGADPLLTGANGRLWASGDKLRLELQASDAGGGGGDVQVLLDGDRLTVIDPGANTVYRIALPKHASEQSGQKANEPVPSVARIQQALTSLAQDATVSGAVPDNVAGRPAYSVRVSPRHDGGLLGGAELDTAFTDVTPDADGRWRVRLRHPGIGGAVTVWADAGAYPWLQVFTGDSLPEPLRRTSGVAVEPMTCPPDAFRSGQDLVVLAPGQEFEGDWGISPA